MAIAFPGPSFCAERSEVAESIDRMDAATSRRVTAARFYCVNKNQDVGRARRHNTGSAATALR
jgi:hypothetical protein